MRIGIVGLLHESNTFAQTPTSLTQFAQQSLLAGQEITRHLAGTHHEVGGFLSQLETSARDGASSCEAVPIFFARALPSGPIDAETWHALMDRLFVQLEKAGPLDGILVAPHGATVSEAQPDADGYWLSRLRESVGPEVPIVGTLDPHANLSRKMVDACTALIAYRTNPHLDQRERGMEAARLLIDTLQGKVRPVMRAEFPPLALSIDVQMTSEPPLNSLYQLADRQLQAPGMLSNSIVLGFPYADVAEMGTSFIAIADGDAALASRMARQLADFLWERRRQFLGTFTGVDQAVALALQSPGPVCLLDMGDNVGGGSAADGTALVHVLREHLLAEPASLPPQGNLPEAGERRRCFACLFDPGSVVDAERAGIGKRVRLTVGGKTDDRHGPPLSADFTVRGLYDGLFSETQPRHGGIAEFDQGRTAVVETDEGLTVMLTSRRMVPFSLQQLTSCGVDPGRFHVLVAKGVNAPIAAYRDVCRSFIRVNTPGTTCADMHQLTYRRRRRPMFPFELIDSERRVDPAVPEAAPSRKGSAVHDPASEFPARGALLGIDFGTKRVGVALSTPDRSIASPLETYERRNESLDAKHFRELVADYRVVGLVVGLPVHVAGHESKKSREARAYGAWLARATNLPVTFWDERFTSAAAEDAMIAIDMTRRQRKTRLDKAAAQLMLQAYLNTQQVQRPPSVGDADA